MILWAMVAVGAAAVGLLAARTAPSPARLLAWLVVLAFAISVSAPDRVLFAECKARTANAAIGSAPAVAPRALAAAAAAGPRAVDLQLSWTDELTDDVAPGPLGAVPVVPAVPLPIDPRRVQVRALAAAMVGRPLVLAVEVPDLPDPLPAQLVVRAADGVVLQQSLQLDGRRVVECPFLPTAAGPHALELSFALAGHRIVARGAFDVAAGKPVLVLEPSGIAAAALRAQGMLVEEAATLPPDWRERPSLVLGQALAPAEQQALVVAVLDGMGLFVAAPAFGASDAPMRALLPVRPLPSREALPGEGAGAGNAAAAPPPAQPDAPPRPEEGPPAGDTAAAERVSPQPIEVDKRAIAMVLVVDRSGSMGNPVDGGRTKMSYAKTSALRTALALGPGDAVALVTFGNKGAARVELPLTDATQSAVVRDGVNRLVHADEQTFLLSGLRAGRELLATSLAAVKHVVVITDGEFNLIESLPLQEVARRMCAEDKITVSVISIISDRPGQSFREEAELLTRAGGGQFLEAGDATVVPVLVSAEVTRALSRIGRQPREQADEQTQPPVAPPEPLDRPSARTAPPTGGTRIPVRAVATSPLLAPLPDPSPWPSLAAAVPGEAPLDANVLLVASAAGWPLLAFGNRGLGRVAAFATDLFGPAATEFRADPAFSGRFAQWVAAVQPPVPVRAPEALVVATTVQPPAPNARDAALLSALTGTAPMVEGELAAPAPFVVSERVPLVPSWAWLLVVAVVALALAERLAAAWVFRRPVAG